MRCHVASAGLGKRRRASLLALSGAEAGGYGSPRLMFRLSAAIWVQRNCTDLGGDEARCEVALLAEPGYGGAVPRWV